MRNTRRVAGGFSLLELVIVMTLLAIMSGAVVPVFRGTFKRVQTDHAVRDFIAVVRYVQERAVTNTTEHRLYLDDENGLYQAKSLKGIEDDIKVFEPVPLVDSRKGIFILPRDLQFDRIKARRDRELGLRYLAFYPNGACDQASVTLRREDGHTVRIKMNGGLGDIEVKERG